MKKQIRLSGEYTNRKKWRQVCFSCRFVFPSKESTCQNNRCKLRGKRLILKLPYVGLL